MPYKSEKIIIAGSKYDKRVKLTPEEREDIKQLYFIQRKPIREIARIYASKVCRRSIQLILFPDRMNGIRANRDWRKYADRKKLTDAVRDLRKRKQNLYLAGAIHLKEEK